jgi:iron complex outermembrane receptor protein
MLRGTGLLALVSGRPKSCPKEARRKPAMIRPPNPAGLARAGALGLTLSASTSALAQQGEAAPDILVVATSPVSATVSGTGVERAKIPGTVHSLTAQEIAADRSSSAVETLGRKIPGVHLTDVQGNEFAQDLRFRGFAASPLQGTPQGLAVYQNGIRINEAFGDTVNWDLILPSAIRGIDVFGSNPVFGLNALGGAVNVEMKNGFNYQGLEAQLTGGSYGRIATALQYGTAQGPWGLYLAGDRVRDAGWRFDSPTRVARFYGDLGYKVPGAEMHLALSRASNTLNVIGPTPVELIRIDRRAIYTSPQVTDNDAASAALSGKFDLSSTWSLQTNAYLRQFDQKRTDGNVADLEACSRASSFGGRICLEDDAFGTPPGGKTQAFRNQFAVVGPTGATIPFVAGAPYGTVDRVLSSSTTVGGSVQATNAGEVLGRSNTLILGTSFEHGSTSLQSSSELGFIYPNLLVAPKASIPGTGIAPIQTLGRLGYAPVDLGATNTYFGAYVSDTLDLTDWAALSLGGRFNFARIETLDQTGAAPELTGKHDFTRFNPFAGLTIKLAPTLSLYGGYSEANRAPTPLELSCADKDRPCLLQNSLVADPPLKQVVSHTYEAGLRGTSLLAPDLKLTWKLGGFRTDSENDILAIASALQGRGYYANVPGTRRQGIEANAGLQADRWSLYASYTRVDATFRFAGTLASPNNPAANADGDILVRPGNRIPLIPRDQLKAGFDYRLTPEWKVGADVVAFSSQFYAGDEGNQNRRLPSYWVVNLHTSYQVGEHVQLFADVKNLFNRRYATYGAFYEVAGTKDAIGVPLTDPRMVTLAQPLSLYGGVKITW